MIFIVILRSYDEESTAYATVNNIRLRFFTPPDFVQNDHWLETLREFMGL